MVARKSFRCFDIQGLGCLATSDFQSALETMNTALADPHPPLTKTQIDVLTRSLPLNSNSQIDYLAFMHAFEVVDTSHYAKGSSG